MDILGLCWDENMKLENAMLFMAYELSRPSASLKEIWKNT